MARWMRVLRYAIPGLFILMAIAPSITCAANTIDDFGCTTLSVVGRIGDRDYLDGVYDRLSAKFNGRSAYRHRLSVPTNVPETSLRGNTLYMYWFEGGVLNKNWAIGTDFGRSTNVLALNENPTEPPELLPSTWQFFTSVNGQLAYVTDPAFRIKCLEDDIRPLRETLRIDLRTAHLSNGHRVPLGGEIEFLCSGATDEPTRAYKVYMATEQAWLNCDISLPNTVIAYMGFCNSSTSSFKVQVKDSFRNVQDGVVPWSGGMYYFLTVDGGYGRRDSIPAGQPREAGIGGLCSQKRMKTFVSVIRDSQPPVFRYCPPSRVVNTDPGRQTAIVSWNAPNATDELGDDSVFISLVTLQDTPGSAFPVGTTRVEYRAVDYSGNVAVCAFNITVIDAEAPRFIQCPTTEVKMQTPEGRKSVAVFWTTPIVQDNRDVNVRVNATRLPGDIFPLGRTTVEYNAQDSAGNKADPCIFTVFVFGSPAVIEQMPVEVLLPHGGDLSLRVRAVGTGPLSYTWRRNGRDIPGEEQALLYLSNVDATLSGTYTVEVRNSFGRTVSDPARVSVLAPARGDNPPDARAYLSAVVKIALPGIRAVIMQDGEPASTVFRQTIAQVSHSTLDVSKCDVLSVDEVISTSRAQVDTLLVDVRVIISTSLVEEARQSLLSSIQNGILASRLRLTGVEPFASGVFISSDVQTVAITRHVDSCRNVACETLLQSPCRNRSLLTKADGCFAGSCWAPPVDDGVPCTREDASSPAMCFGGVCEYALPPRDCEVTLWSTWSRVTPSPASNGGGGNTQATSVSRNRSLTTLQANGGACPFVLVETVDCTKDLSSTQRAMCVSLGASTGSSDKPFFNSTGIAVVAASCGGLFLVLLVFAILIRRRMRKSSSSALTARPSSENSALVPTSVTNPFFIGVNNPEAIKLVRKGSGNSYSSASSSSMDSFDSLVMRMESSASGRCDSTGAPLVRSSSQYLDENGLTQDGNGDLFNPYDQYEKNSIDVDDLSLNSQEAKAASMSPHALGADFSTYLAIHSNDNLENTYPEDKQVKKVRWGPVTMGEEATKF